MGARRKKAAGAAALSVTALATVMGAQPAAANFEECVSYCVIGPDDPFDKGDGSFHKFESPAFHKFADPTSPFHKDDGSFSKWEDPASAFYKEDGSFSKQAPGLWNAFGKHAERGFPGNTEDAFAKVEHPFLK